MKRRVRRSRLGATVVESLIAMAVLAVGTAAVAELVRSIMRANERAAFQTRSLEIYQRVASQVRVATCDIYPNAVGDLPTSLSSDDGFLDPAAQAPNWRGDAAGPIPGSAITHIGLFDDTGRPNAVNPSYGVDYQYAPDATGSLRAFDLLIRIREITPESTADNFNATGGSLTNRYIRTYPVKKVCNYRSIDSTRGGFPT
ncbi:MAG: hypothetical protein HY791_19825 [Deltaproteobacteria bacterium]|nr:hypothetical protein [Deltaproteobacteria bacterium]